MAQHAPRGARGVSTPMAGLTKSAGSGFQFSVFSVQLQILTHHASAKWEPVPSGDLMPILRRILNIHAVGGTPSSWLLNTGLPWLRGTPRICSNPSHAA